MRICIRYTCCQIEIILPSSNVKCCFFLLWVAYSWYGALRAYDCGATEYVGFTAQCKQKILLNTRSYMNGMNVHERLCVRFFGIPFLLYLFALECIGRFNMLIRESIHIPFIFPDEFYVVFFVRF